MNKVEKTVNLLVSLMLLGLFSSCTSTENVSIRIAKYRDDKTCAISYTYDDGMTEHYTLVVPEMEKRGFRGTFWVNGKSVNADNTHTTDTARLNWENLKEMAGNGHEISNHGWSHANLTRITLEETAIEIDKNDSIIFEKIEIPSRTFCYPYNAYNEEILKVASENRVGTRTKQYAIGSKSTSEKLEQWVNTLIETGDWGVAMIHGINYGYDAFTSAGILWQHFDDVKAWESSVWVGTFREVAAYISEYENIEYDAVWKKNKIEVTPKLTLDSQLFDEQLTMVVEKEGLKTLTATQGQKRLNVQLYTDKAVFNFDPYGPPVEIVL